MTILLMKISFALLAMETVIGMVANGFIILTNFFDWIRSRRLSPTDMILSCLCLSRLMWLSHTIVDRTATLFSLNIYIWNSTKLMASIMWLSTNSANIWFATWLSVFYFAKIAIFSHPVFLQVKQRISGLVPWLLLGSVIFSALTATIIMTSLNDGFSMCCPSNDSKITEPDSWKYMNIVGMVTNLIPFLIFLSSSIMLIVSLWKHTRHVRHNGICVRDLSTQAHLTAIKTLASFTVLYLLNFLALTSEAVLIWNGMDNSWSFMLLNAVTAAYPSEHTIILILINPKLKQTWVRMLHHFNCCLSEASS